MDCPQSLSIGLAYVVVSRYERVMSESESLSQFAARRLPVVRKEIERLRAALREAEHELSALSKVELPRQPKIFRMVISENLVVGAKAYMSHTTKIETMQDAALAVLHDARMAMTAFEMLPLINERLGTKYERSSLSPQLSRLKNEGRLTLLPGNKWGLVERHESTDADAGDRKDSRSNSADASGQGRASADYAQPGANDREAGPGGGT